MDFIPIMTEQGNQIAVQTLFETGDIEFTRIEIGSGRNAYPEKSTALNNAVISGQFLGCGLNSKISQMKQKKCCTPMVVQTKLAIRYRHLLAVHLI